MFCYTERLAADPLHPLSDAQRLDSSGKTRGPRGGGNENALIPDVCAKVHNLE